MKFDTKAKRFDYTPEQSAVIEAVKESDAPLVIDAVAGSGKTTTIVAAAKATKDAQFLAYNRSIADELKREYQLKARTLHSLGFAICRSGTNMRVELDQDRTERFLKANPPFKGQLLEAKTFADKTELIHVRRKLRYTCRLISRCKNHGIYPDDPRLTKAGLALFSLQVNMTPTFDVTDQDLDEVYSTTIRYISEVYHWENHLAPLIDFDDMLYVAVALLKRGAVSIRQALRGSTTVFVDEAQDLNPVQHDLLKHIAEEARVVAVGDRGQAIYGFRGAVNNSIDAMKQALGEMWGGRCGELPLNTCFRCPRSHVALAAKVRPGIRPMAVAIDGLVERMMDSEIVPRVIDAWANGERDIIIICRRKAPLLGVAIRLLLAQIPVMCQGEDLISRLLAELESFPRDMPTDECYEILFVRYEKIAKKAEEKGLDRSGAIRDWLNAVSVTLNESDTVGGAMSLLYDLKNRHSRGASIKVMTIHRAKGLEAKNVCVLQHNTMPLMWKNQSEEEARQEKNVLYVALTRSKKNLYLGIAEESSQRDRCETE